jgi:hypothetical protein
MGAIAGCVFATACGGGGSSSGSNSTTTITAISPSTAEWNSAAFTLAVTGSGLDRKSVVQLNGNPRSTTYVNSNQLNVSILATDTLQAGTDQVTVTASSGQTSNAVPFVIPCVLAQDTPAPEPGNKLLGDYHPKCLREPIQVRFCVVDPALTAIDVWDSCALTGRGF